MKLWLCVLSALLLAGCAAGTDVPDSVTPTAVPTPPRCGDRGNGRGRGDARTHRGRRAAAAGACGDRRGGAGL